MFPTYQREKLPPLFVEEATLLPIESEFGIGDGAIKYCRGMNVPGFVPAAIKISLILQ